MSVQIAGHRLSYDDSGSRSLGKVHSNLGTVSFQGHGKRSCRNIYVHGHELGHNFGCDHDVANKLEANDSPYGYGYLMEENRHTIMA